jgi:hypothetical protein
MHELIAKHEGQITGTLSEVCDVEMIGRSWPVPGCHQGQFLADGELDVVDTELSPGVRRMQALVGQEVSFDHGREQMKLLAGLEVTAKSVERGRKASAPLSHAGNKKRSTVRCNWTCR